MHLLDVIVKATGCEVGNVIILADSLGILVKTRNTANFHHAKHANL